MERTLQGTGRAYTGRGCRPSGKINFLDLVAHLVMDGLRSASKAEAL
ncbi:hypothetical protein [Kibdelosporangium philippinense]